MRRAIGVVISGLRRSIWLSWSKSLYETSLRPCSSITSEYSRAGVRTSLNPNSRNRSRILPCTSSNRVDSGGSTSRVPGVVANFRGVSRSIREAILTDGRSLDGHIELTNIYNSASPSLISNLSSRLDGLRFAVLIGQQLIHVRESPAGSLVVVDDLRQRLCRLPVGVVQQQHVVPFSFSSCLVRAHDAPHHILGTAAEQVVARVDRPHHGEKPLLADDHLELG